MKVKYAVARSPVVPPPKSRVNTRVAPIARGQRRAPPPLPESADVPSAELDAVRGLLDGLVAGRYEVLIFMTGNSVWSLFELAQELGRHRDLVRTLQAVTTACRSPKAAAILRRFGVQPTLGERGLFTTRRLSYALGRLNLEGLRVVRLNGAPGDAIANRLREQRARLRELKLSHRRTPIKASMSEPFSLTERGVSRGLRAVDASRQSF
ncbi:MAG TPA: uroporphyrinogen-III synthase [Polyangiaceae bacterium]